MNWANGNIDSANIKALTSGSWIAPTFQNSWVNLATATPAGYLKDALGFVHLRGRINGGSSGTTVFTLPSGYRPGTSTAGDLYAIGVNNNIGSPVAGFANINSAGAVAVSFGAGATDLALGGITFLAEN